MLRRLANVGYTGTDAEMLVDFIVNNNKKVTVEGTSVVFHPPEKGGAA